MISPKTLFLSDEHKTFQVAIPPSWAGLIALLTIEDGNMLQDQYDDLHVIRQFARLQFSSTQDLKAEYKKRLKKKCPLGIEREDLILRLIHQIQKELYRPEQARSEQKITNPAAFNKRALEMAVQGSTTELADGTILERDYKGEIHVVRRVDEKYEYKSNRYNSLTEIAQRITGTQCSGPAFFSRKTKIL